MSRFAIIVDGVVQNIVKADAEMAEANGWIDATGAKIGSTWDSERFTDPLPEPIDPKIEGIEILGVMCSATKEDQNGLTAIATGVMISRGAAQTFPDTVFEFANGNKLTINDSNFDAIYSAWVPFRQSFFAV